MSFEDVTWSNEQKCKKTVESLKKNGFEAVYCEDRKHAYEYIINAADNAVSIGFGGSMTIAELKLIPELRNMGKELLIHGLPELSKDEKFEVMRRQLTCDLFLASTNALTLSGQLVNIDANGNRVGPMFFGPKKVIIVVGRNKIVEDTEAALKRIKQYAAPPNAHRLNRKTPCAATGFCSNCDSPDRICRITVILDRLPGYADITVLVINEDLGF
jgi:hypothetical protein